MKKINLGSGPYSAKGWINYDWGLLPFLGKFRLTSVLVKIGLLPSGYRVKWPKISMVDIREELPDEDDSIDYIYCSNVIEHFEKSEAIKIFKECRRVLKNKGIIRIVVPDLKKLLNNYINADTFNREYLGYDKDLFNGMLGRIKKYFVRGHQWMYDQASMKALLAKAGFNKIKLCQFRKGRVPDLNKLDLEVHKKLGIYYEATK